MVDCLHAADQGISAVSLASFFVLPKLPGHSEADKISALLVDICAHCNREHIDSRLDNLTVKMLGKKPKLRAKAAETRGLINFACELVDAHLTSADPIKQSAKLATKHLQHCYTTLSPLNYHRQELANASRNFCLLLRELEKRTLFVASPQSYTFFRSFAKCLQSIHP